MSLPEAAALFFPAGPLTTTSLRTARATGKLDVVEIAGKHLTTKAAIARMSVCRSVAQVPERDVVPVRAPATVAEMRRMRRAGGAG